VTTVLKIVDAGCNDTSHLMPGLRAKHVNHDEQERGVRGMVWEKHSGFRYDRSQ
jgi:hypothetical protein